MPVLHGVIWQSDLLRGAQAQSNEDAQEHQRLLSAAQGRSASLASRAASVSAVDEHEHEDEHASTCLSLLTVEDDGAVALGKSSSVSSLSASTRRALEKLAEKRRTAAPVLLRLARSTGGDLSVISLDATLDGRAEQQLRRRAFDRDELHKLNQLAQLGRSLSSRPSTAMSGKSCSVSDYPVENHSGAGLGLVGWKVRRMRAHSQRQKAAPRRIAFADEPVALERDARRTVQLQARSSFKSPSTEQLSLSLQRNTVLSSLPRDYLFSTYNVCKGEPVNAVKNLRLRTPAQKMAASASASYQAAPAYAWRAQPKLHITKQLATELQKELRATEQRLNGQSADPDSTLWRPPQEHSLRKTYNMPEFYYKNLHLFDWFNDQYDLPTTSTSRARPDSSHH